MKVKTGVTGDKVFDATKEGETYFLSDNSGWYFMSIDESCVTEVDTPESLRVGDIFTWGSGVMHYEFRGMVDSMYIFKEVDTYVIENGLRWNNFRIIKRAK